jgi:hypothetical protein
MARLLIPAFLVAALVTAPAVAARRRAAVVTPDALTITFVAAVGDTVDAGTIAHDFSKRAAKAGTTTVTRTFALRVDRRDGSNAGLVSLRASLETEDPRCTLRVDGVEIHITPMTIAIVPIGTATTHRLEITVPVSAEEGALLTSIRWEAASEENSR